MTSHDTRDPAAERIAYWRDAYERGRADERARIVAMLREEHRPSRWDVSLDHKATCQIAADIIESETTHG